LENEHSLILISAWDPSQRGLGKVNPRTIEDDLLVKHLDVAIPVRDGTILRGNIVLPKARAGEKLPVIFNYSLYGKDGGTDIAIFPAAAGLEASRLTKDYLFEAADAGWWCPRGYIVATIDARGSYQSDGDKSYYSRDVGLDGRFTHSSLDASLLIVRSRL
jgi:predicted acyl esterase